MATPMNISIPTELRLQVKRAPLPAGVKWSHVITVMMMASVAEKKGTSQEDFRKLIEAKEEYKKVRAWIKDMYEDYLD
jgi:hypothetical protein